MPVRHLTATVATALLLLTAPAAPAFAEDAPSVPTQDATFLKAIHQSNLAEIASGRDAQRNATTPCVKRVGRALIQDHTRLDQQGKELAKRLGVSLPSTPTREQQQALSAVRAKAGSQAYDQAWTRTQARAHERALRLIEQELDSGSNDQVQTAAQAARPVIARHLDMVRDGVCRG